jgi:membrane-associated phospholipid phosphatase
MRSIIEKHALHWSNKYFAYSTLVGLALFAVSLYLNNAASAYALRSASSSVNDIILDNVPIVNVGWIVSTGAFLFFIFAAIAGIIHPKKLPFLLKCAAFFIVIRAAFVTLTHLGPMPHSYIDTTDYFSSYNVGTDYFFSGHTGLPYLVALVFWDSRWIRNVSLAAAAIFGVSVLLGHLHYSIDVFAAFFITYAIFILAQKFFARDFEISIS